MAESIPAFISSGKCTLNYLIKPKIPNKIKKTATMWFNNLGFTRIRIPAMIANMGCKEIFKAIEASFEQCHIVVDSG